MIYFHSNRIENRTLGNCFARSFTATSVGERDPVAALTSDALESKTASIERVSARISGKSAVIFEKFTRELLRILRLEYWGESLAGRLSQSSRV